MEAVCVHTKGLGVWLLKRVRYAGFAYAENIWVRRESVSEYLLRHEFRHIMQQREEGLITFTVKYWWQLLKSLVKHLWTNWRLLFRSPREFWSKAYKANPYEVEAKRFGRDDRLDVAVLMDKLREED